MKPVSSDDIYLDQKLHAYSKSDYYPFHMPGHKRRPLDFPNPYTIDLTEIDGFDNLHHAEGIIKEAQNRARALYRAKETYFLVNGSTCGILSAISAAIPKGGTLLMGRNCHKSAYHAVYLRDLHTRYLMPSMTDFGILGSIAPEQAAAMLKKHPDIQGVFLTSPTYDGMVSDIRNIAHIVHKHGLPLIVDEAHGAHFPFSGEFPESALASGADIVIQSLHKTLPCFTQTALLHMGSDRIPPARLKQFLDIYQTSSPSYLFMASMEQCIRTMKEQGAALMDDFTLLLRDFYEKTADFKQLKIFPGSPALERNCFDRDFSKILIGVGTTGYTGQELYDLLLAEYHLQMELVSGHYVTALTSLMDTKEGLHRLFLALNEIDHMDSFSGKKTQTAGRLLTNQELYTVPRQYCSVSDALESPGISVPLAESAGQISQEFIYLYPPGIPLIAPGEEITEELLERIRLCKEQGLAVEGLADMSSRRICVIPRNNCRPKNTPNTERPEYYDGEM